MAIYTAALLEEAVAHGTTRDMVIIDMVSNHDYSLNSATKLYAELAKDLGIATGKKSRKDEAIPLLNTSSPMSADDIRDECDGVANTLGITSKTVQGYLKEIYELNDWHWPAVGSASEAILDWLTANHECNKEQFEKFMATASDNGTKRSQSNINEYWKGMTLHRRITAKLAAQAAAE